MSTTKLVSNLSIQAAQMTSGKPVKVVHVQASVPGQGKGAATPDFYPIGRKGETDAWELGPKLQSLDAPATKNGGADCGVTRASGKVDVDWSEFAIRAVPAGTTVPLENLAPKPGETVIEFGGPNTWSAS